MGQAEGAQAVVPIAKVGRIVHYTNLGDADGKYPPETQAAIITGINQGNTVALHIFYKTGQFDMPSVPYSFEPKRGHWNWPEDSYVLKTGKENVVGEQAGFSPTPKEVS